ncbi:MAG TPA: hypothetical protein ENK57_04130 [Polyangiaceae bacterium]|nr:hypothetical protein [Polyangiaceae bacterium]
MSAPVQERARPVEVTHELVVVADDPARAAALVRELGLPNTPVFDATGVGEWALVPARTVVLWEIVPDQERLRRRIQIASTSSHVVVVSGVEHPEVIELTLREGATILTWPGSDAALAASLHEYLRGRGHEERRNEPRGDEGHHNAVVLNSERLADELHRALSRRLDQSSPSIQIADVSRMDRLIDRLTTEILAEAQAAPVAALDWDDMPTAVQTPEESGRFRTLAAAARMRASSSAIQMESETAPTRVTARPKSPTYTPRPFAIDHSSESIMETSQYPMLPPPLLPDLDEPLPRPDATVRDVVMPDRVDLAALSEPDSAAQPAVESLRPSGRRRGLWAPIVAVALVGGVATGVALWASARPSATAARSVVASDTPIATAAGAIGTADVATQAMATPATSVQAATEQVPLEENRTVSGADATAEHGASAVDGRSDGITQPSPTRSQRAQRAAARARGHLAHGRHTAALRAARMANRLARGAPAYAALLAEIEGAADAATAGGRETPPAGDGVTARETAARETAARETAARETAAPDDTATESTPALDVDEVPTNPYSTPAPVEAVPAAAPM